MTAEPEASVTELSQYRERRTRPEDRAGHGGPALALREAALAPPTGTVTFLLTDVEGSTPRWEASPDEMTRAVARHYEILDAAVTAHGGVRPIEQGEGDSLVAAFERASDAVAAALQAQAALAAEPWTAGAEIAVRMALHTGEARLRDDVYYVGPSIIRCARLRSLGHGGQVLLSAPTADLLVDALPRDAALLPLGSHRLKGLRQPERVFQLTHPQLPAQFPPLAAAEAPPGNLPAQLTSFVGREAELAELVDLTARHRMVTLVGAGGTGKTRLAAQVADAVAERYPDGAWWVELAALTDPAAVPGAVMAALGLEDTRPDPVARIAAYLRDRQALLVLDNCEHLLGAARDLLAAVLAGCPRTAAVATSREPLGPAGEVVWRVPPLSVPAWSSRGPRADDGPQAVADVLATESVRLFAERAAEARPGFRVDASNAATIGQLCARLDGLPLAVELAAARIRGLTPERILDGLERRFALLTGSGRGSAAHQQTLAASMEWSHDLLTEHQQVLLRRLSPFTGRFGLDDVEAVAAGGPLTPFDCMLLLAELVDRSLVVFDGEHYRLLQTVADFAAGRLAAAGEDAAIRTAHLAHYAALSAAAAAELNAAPQVETLERLEVARNDILAAIDRAVAAGDHAPALAIAADTTTFWHMRSRYAESLAYLRRVLAACPDTPSRDRARVLWGVSQLALYGMDVRNAYGTAEATAALEMAQAVGASDVIGRALCMRVLPLVFMKPADALEPMVQARELALAGGDRFGANLATVFRAFAATFGLDDAGTAAPELARLAAEAGPDGSPYWGFWHAICAGSAAFHAGRLAEAVAVLEPAVLDAYGFGDSQSECFGAMPLADALVDLGRADDAEQVIARCVAWQDRSSLGRAEIMLVKRARNILATGGTPAEAESWLSAGEAVIRSIGFDFATVEFDLVRARTAEESGDLAAARTAVDEALRLAEGLGMPWGRAWAAYTHGRVARAEGRTGEAEDALHRSLELCVRHSYSHRAAEVLEALGSLACTGESWDEAARLYGAAAGLRERTGFVRSAVDAPLADADAAATAAALGPEAYAAATREGGALTLPEATAYAAAARAVRKRPASGWDALTPAELDVVELAARGLTNAEIGHELHVAAGTVKTHLYRIFAKLGVSRRSELAALATERRLT